MPEGDAASDPRGGDAADVRYCAFLSYSHSDEKNADWLHRCLEQFRVPRALVGRGTARGIIPPSLGVVFRDRQELAASSDLGGSIRGAIAQSRALIVLCSPAAAASRWTNAEIREFKQNFPDRLVLAAIVAGEPFASDIPGLEAEECFPPALRERFDAEGKPTGERAEPIAADLREGRDGKRMGLLKLVAGLLGVGLDELVQRETHRRQKRLMILAAASLAGMGVTSALAVAAVFARDEARDQRREAEGLVGFMLGDLRDKLQPLGRLDVLDAVGERALRYYRGQDKASLSDDALAQRSKALTLIGEIAQTRGQLDAALQRYREALAGTAEALRRDPTNQQRIFDHAQNVFWVGYIAYQRGQKDDALRAFQGYKALADRLVALNPDKPEWRLERLYADTNLGIVQHDEGQDAAAAATFQRGLTEIEALAASAPKDADYRTQLSQTLAYLADSFEGEGHFDEALAQRERQAELLQQDLRVDPANAALKRQIMTNHGVLGRLFASRGEVGEAQNHYRAASALADEIMRTEPGNTEWAQYGAATFLEIGELDAAQGQIDRAGAAARTGCDITERLIARDSSVVYWSNTLRGDCLALRARLALARGADAEAGSLAAQLAAAARSELKRAPGSDARIALASAEMLQGQVAAASGQAAAARALWAQAAADWPQAGGQKPFDLARHAVLLRLSGQPQAAAALDERLATMGYRHPEYLAAKQSLARLASSQ
jgi:tetratricopeptide (TPR) repeat protein